MASGRHGSSTHNTSQSILALRKGLTGASGTCLDSTLPWSLVYVRWYQAQCEAVRVAAKARPDLIIQNQRQGTCSKGSTHRGHICV